MKSTLMLTGLATHAGRILCLFLSLSVFSACATGPQLVDHAFGFDVRLDTPPVTLLDYAYGDQYRMTRAEPHLVKEGRIGQQSGVDGAMPRGEFLYAKWRLNASGEVFEDRVDLRNRLPADIERNEIRFSIKGSQLHVYLITRRKRDPSSPTGPLISYQDREVIKIYPEQPKY